MKWWKNVVKPVRPQMTIWCMSTVCWITRSKLGICDTYWFSAATVVTWTCLSVTLYVPRQLYLNTCNYFDFILSHLYMLQTWKNNLYPRLRWGKGTVARYTESVRDVPILHHYFFRLCIWLIMWLTVSSCNGGGGIGSSKSCSSRSSSSSSNSSDAYWWYMIVGKISFVHSIKALWSGAQH